MPDSLDAMIADGAPWAAREAGLDSDEKMICFQVSIFLVAKIYSRYFHSLNVRLWLVEATLQTVASARGQRERKILLEAAFFKKNVLVAVSVERCSVSFAQNTL